MISSRIPLRERTNGKISLLNKKLSTKNKNVSQPVLSRPLKAITNRQKTLTNASSSVQIKKELIKENVNKVAVTKKESEYLHPKSNLVHNQLQLKSFSTSQLPPGVDDIDKKMIDNELLANEYVKDIYNYLRDLEKVQKVEQNHLRMQMEVTPKMRSILVDWLIKVHDAFHLLGETLYLAIYILDKFLQKCHVSKSKLQLVGATSLFLASKFEEIYPPAIDDLVTMCDGLYHKADIIKMEMSILKTLSFDIGRPSPLHFLRRFSQACQSTVEIHTMSKYLMELTLTEYEFASWTPSLLAASSLYISLKLFNPEREWTNTMVYYSGFKEEEILLNIDKLIQLIKSSKESPFQTCLEKYENKKFLSISRSKYMDTNYVEHVAAKLRTLPLKQ